MDDAVAQFQPLTAQKTNSGPDEANRTEPSEPGSGEGGFLAQFAAQFSRSTASNAPLTGALLATTGNVQNVGDRLGGNRQGIGRHGDSTKGTHGPGGGGRVSAVPNLAQLASSELASPGIPAPNPAQSTSDIKQNVGSGAGSKPSGSQPHAATSSPESGKQAPVSSSGSNQTAEQSTNQSQGPKTELAQPTSGQAEKGQSRTGAEQSAVRSAQPVQDAGAAKPNQSARANVAAPQSGAVRGVGATQSGANLGFGTRSNSGGMGEGNQARGAKHAAPTAQLARPRSFQLEQKAFGAQVQNGLAAALKRSGGTVTMRLTPHALGFMRIKLELRDGVVGARFEASTDQARRLLEQNMASLRTALEAKGLQVEKLIVRLSQEGSTGGSQDASHEDDASESAREGHEQSQRYAVASAAMRRDGELRGQEADQAELGPMGENPSETEIERDEQGHVLRLNALA